MHEAIFKVLIEKFQVAFIDIPLEIEKFSAFNFASFEISNFKVEMKTGSFNFQ